jgi:hypothetical protein
MHEGAIENAVLLEAQAFIDVVAGGEGVVSGGHARIVGEVVSVMTIEHRSSSYAIWIAFEEDGCRSALVVLAALALGACADSPRRTDRIVAPPSLDASASRILLQCPTSQSASAFALLGLLGGVVSLGGNSVALPFGAVSLYAIGQ